VWFSSGVLNVDVTGDARADMQIEISALSVADLIL
jgi:hypothetical protein